MTHSSELIAVLSENPSDFDLYLVTADLLEEEGNWQLARAYRWCGMNQKHPLNMERAWGWSWTWNNGETALEEFNRYRLPYSQKQAREDGLWGRHQFGSMESFQVCLSSLATHFEALVNCAVPV